MDNIYEEETNPLDEYLDNMGCPAIPEELLDIIGNGVLPDEESND